MAADRIGNRTCLLLSRRPGRIIRGFADSRGGIEIGSGEWGVGKVGLLFGTERFHSGALNANRHYEKIVLARISRVFDFTKSPFGGLNGDFAKVRFGTSSIWRDRY